MSANAGAQQVRNNWSPANQSSAIQQNGLSLEELAGNFYALKDSLAQYSQHFSSGERQLDPDKLSKVMFMCGLAVGAKNRTRPTSI